MPGTERAIRVAAGILMDGEGRVLLAQRPPGTDMAGGWEFPGGKIEPGETPELALARELREEIGVDVGRTDELKTLHHVYPGKQVELHFRTVLSYTGTPQALEGQALAWVPVGELHRWNILEADWPVVNAMRLPPLYLVTPEPGPDPQLFLIRLGHAIRAGVSMVQFRAPGLSEAGYSKLLPAVIETCRQGGVELVVHARPELAMPDGVAGVHLTSAQLLACARRPRPRGTLVGASCHTMAEIDKASALGLDYVTVGTVRTTPSHPEPVAPLGYEGFAELVRRTELPAYAIGGMTRTDVEAIRAVGGHGIAAIRALWDSQERRIGS